DLPSPALCSLSLHDALPIFEGDDDPRELAGATGLLLVRVLHLLRRAADGLPVGDLRLADVRLDLELAAHAVDEHVEVELAHPARSEEHTSELQSRENLVCRL